MFVFIAVATALIVLSGGRKSEPRRAEPQPASAAKNAAASRSVKVRSSFFCILDPRLSFRNQYARRTAKYARGGETKNSAAKAAEFFENAVYAPSHAVSA